MATGSTITPTKGRPARTVYPFEALNINDFFYNGQYTEEAARKMRNLVQQYYKSKGKSAMFAVGNDGEGFLIVKRTK